MGVEGRPHYRLDAWKHAMSLVREVYRLTRVFPEDEKFGLVQQMRRAAVSVPSNIAEGAARNGQKEFLQFLSIAKGSLSELETQLLISLDLGYVAKNDDVFEQLEIVSKLLAGVHKSVKRRLVAIG
jgi:four helix bundle protein